MAKGLNFGIEVTEGLTFSLCHLLSAYPGRIKLKRELLEKGPEVFAHDNSVAEYEQRIAQLEQLLGKKEVEIALLKNFLGQRS